MVRLAISLQFAASLALPGILRVELTATPVGSVTVFIARSNLLERNLMSS